MNILSREQNLDKQVAEIVVGWKNVRLQDPQEDPEREPQLMGFLNSKYEEYVPKYSKNANVVISLLNQLRWDVNYNPSYKTYIFTLNPLMHHPKEYNKVIVENENFCFGACEALLKFYKK